MKRAFDWFLQGVCIAIGMSMLIGPGLALWAACKS